MTSAEIRQQFLDFFASKGHQVVPSAPIVVKNDPTLMFTNSGMNQFKDWFLGNETPKYKRVVDTQKCLRVSGKHDDLEEVGIDTYHHTMFEMLGNWSFGDYFKTEAIEWAWELLTKVYGLEKDRLYVSVFEGDESENIPFDQEAYDLWKERVDETHIIRGNKKDNFWEMADIGPCGPCTEIHVDLRPGNYQERNKVKTGASLVNNDDPQVIEIWNNVFMQFERVWDEEKGGTQKLKEWSESYKGEDFKKDRAKKVVEFTKLIELPLKCVDTGMGFERLVRAIEGKSSNYDTDVFVPTIKLIEQHSGISYKHSGMKQDVAMRVMADHIRAISFTIADGQLPSNNGAGYVIRRILRRAVRYQYQFLNIKEPFLCKLALIIADSFKNVFPELYAQKDFVAKVISEEELSFLKTLENGIAEINKLIDKELFTSTLCELMTNANILFSYDVTDREFEVEGSFKFKVDFSRLGENYGRTGGSDYAVSVEAILKKNLLLENEDFKFLERIDTEKLRNIVIKGTDAFKMSDTFGFPLDLTKLIASEYGYGVDEAGFEAALQQQKDRSRKATELTTDDWTEVNTGEQAFTGYDTMEADNAAILRLRKVKKGKTELVQVVIDQCPFYPEGGGQVGDTGKLYFKNGEVLEIIDTVKENGIIMLIAEKAPSDPFNHFTAQIDGSKRRLTENNHSATHLLHAALREVLGTHVQQKGSLVNEKYLRFDFSHFSAMTPEEIAKVEHLVNEKVRENIALDERRSVPIEEAKTLGAMMLFGEKYGESVRVITFGESKELCGGTHIKATGQIGYFKIMGESAVAAGVRRIEAITADAVEELVNSQYTLVNELKSLLSAKDLKKSVEQLLADKNELSKKLEAFENEKTTAIKENLKSAIRNSNGVNVLIRQVEVPNAEQLKNLSFQLKNDIENLFCVLGCDLNGKPMLSVIMSDNLVKEKGWHAGNMVKELAKQIQGGGGGQPFYATAGGNNLNGLNAALEKAGAIIN